MNMKRKIYSGLLSIGLILSALPAHAVSYNGTWTLNRYNTGGTTYAILRPLATNFCYLNKVGVRETDTGSEAAICTVRRSGSVWVLEATLGRSSDNDVFCQATCATNY